MDQELISAPVAGRITLSRPSNLDRALELAFRGYELFPCRESPGLRDGQVVKSPYLSSDPIGQSTRDPEVLERWWTDWPNALIGVPTGPNSLIVADIDVKHGKNGYRSLADRSLVLPPTFNYPTPNGGAHHVYFDLNARRLKQVTNLDGMTGVDRQTGASYVIWYGDVPTEDDDIAAAPAWLNDTYGSSVLYPAAPAFTGSLARWMNDLSDESASPAVRGFLDQIGETAHIGNGELIRFTFRLAVLAAERQSGVRGAHDRLRERYWATSHGSELAKEAEWNRLLRGAIAQTEEMKRRGDLFEQPGVLTAIQIGSARASAAVVQPVVATSGTTPAAPALRPDAPPVPAAPVAPTAPAPPGIRVLTLPDLAAIPKPTWWVEGLVRQASLGIFAGKGGLGKTLLMLHLSAAVAAGVDFFGLPVKQTSVLYVGAEGIEDFDSRIRALCGFHHIPRGPLEQRLRFIEAGVNLADGKSMDQLAEILEHGKFGLVVLDTFSQTASLENENDAAEVAGIFRTARALRGLVPQSSIVLVHHASKESGRYRGSTAIRDNVDTLVSVIGSPSGFYLSTEADDAGKQRSGAPVRLDGFELVPHLTSAVVARTGALPKTKASHDWLRIKDLLADGTARSMDEIAADSGIAKRVVERVTKPYRDDGTLSSERHGKSVKYVLVPESPSGLPT